MTTRIHDKDLSLLIQRASLVTIAERIREARLEAKLTLDQLGVIVESSRSHLIQLEKAKHRPRVKMLRAIGEATGRDVQWFVGIDNGDAPLSADGHGAD